MNTSYYDVDAWDGWDDFSWLLDEQNVPSSYEAESLFQPQNDHVFLPHYAHNSHNGPSDVSKFETGYSPQHCQTNQAPLWTLPLPPILQTSAVKTWWPDIFDRVPPCLDPPDTGSLQKQAPRFEGDLYAAPYVKGEGVERAGWCGFCSSWHKLKDSAYWYVVTCVQLQHEIHVFITASIGTTCTTLMESAVSPAVN